MTAGKVWSKEMRTMDTHERTAFRRWCADMTRIGNRSRSIEDWVKAWVMEKPRWSVQSDDTFGVIKKEIAVTRKNETSDTVLDDRQKTFFVDTFCRHSGIDINDFLMQLDFVIGLHDKAREIKIAHASLAGQIFSQPLSSLPQTIDFLIDLNTIIVLIGDLPIPDHDMIIKVQNTDYQLKKVIATMEKNSCSVIIGQGVKEHIRRMESVIAKAFTTHTTFTNIIDQKPIYSVIEAEIRTDSKMDDMISEVKSIVAKLGTDKWIARPKVMSEMYGDDKKYKTREHVAGTLKDIFYRKATSLGTTETTKGLLLRERNGAIYIRLNQ